MKNNKYIKLTPSQALLKAANYCAYQERCHIEVLEKLSEWGIWGFDAQEILLTLIEQNYLNEELKDLVDGKTSINELVITKSIKASYKDPSKIAHKVLADRIGARDPGNRPCVNERIPFV